MSERLLTTRQVAARLGVSPETVLRWWRRGELPGYRLGRGLLRFDEGEIRAWLDARHRGDRAARVSAAGSSGIRALSGVHPEEGR